jgi:hypothetical protein
LYFLIVFFSTFGSFFGRSFGERERLCLLRLLSCGERDRRRLVSLSRERERSRWRRDLRSRDRDRDERRLFRSGITRIYKQKHSQEKIIISTWFVVSHFLFRKKSEKIYLKLY